MHEIEYVVLDCSICDFHFSPSEKTVDILSNSIVLPTTEMKCFYKENISFRIGDPLPMLRAPPIHI